MKTKDERKEEERLIYIRAGKPHRLAYNAGTITWMDYLVIDTAAWHTYDNACTIIENER